MMEAIIESLKLLPFLLITYLAMETLEHKSEEKTKAAIKKSGAAGPLLGGLLGAFPQCGFSAAASNLYAGRVITVGTLIAIYLSTSDEMLPILISESVPVITIVKILSAKVIIGMVTGYILEFVRVMRHIKREEINIHEICEAEHCHCEHHHEHKDDEKGALVIIRSACIHTIKIFVFILVISVVLHLVMEHGGEEVLENVLVGTPLVGELLAALVGLIPNCAGSVVITKLYLEGILSAGAMMSGLLVSAGVGVLVLFRVNRKYMKKNLAILGILYGSGVLWGLLIELVGITF